MVECVAPPDLLLSTRHSNDTMYNSTVRYDCDIGTAINPNATREQNSSAVITRQDIICNEAALWTPDVFNCSGEHSIARCLCYEM